MILTFSQKKRMAHLRTLQQSKLIDMVIDAEYAISKFMASVDKDFDHADMIAPRDYYIECLIALSVPPQLWYAKSKVRSVITARQIAALLIRINTTASYSDISIAVNLTDHSTSIHNVKKAMDLIEVDDDFQDKFMICLKHIERKYTVKLSYDYSEIKRKMHMLAYKRKAGLSTKNKLLKKRKVS